MIKFNYKVVSRSLALVTISIGLSACQQEKSAPPQASNSSAPAPSTSPSTSTPPIISTIEVRPTDLSVIGKVDIEQNWTAAGSIKAQKVALIKSKISGELVEFPTREGMTVKAGQVIAKVDDQDARLRLNERSASGQAARAQLELATRQFNNQKQLFDRGFISQAALDSSQTQLDVARSNLESTQAALRIVEKSIGDSIIRSPITGTVSELFVQPGEKVSVDTRLASVIDLASLQFEASVPSEQALNLKIGQQVSISVDGNSTSMVGMIDRISPSTATGTRAIPVYVKLINPIAGLRAGMFARGTVVTGIRSQVIAVPTSAIRESAGRQFVYVLSNEQTVQERTVSVGTSQSASSAQAGTKSIPMSEILSGVAVGEKIIATNLGPLRPNTKVVVANAKN